MTLIPARACHTAPHNTFNDGAQHCACWWKPRSATTPTAKPGAPTDTARYIKVGPGVVGGWDKMYLALDWRWRSPWPSQAGGTSHDGGFILNCHNTAWDNGNTGSGGVGWGFGNGVSSVALDCNPTTGVLLNHIENNGPTYEQALTMPAADTWQSFMWEITMGLKSADYVSGMTTYGSVNCPAATVSALTGGTNPVGRVRCWQDGTLTLDTNDYFPGGVRTLQVARNPANLTFYIQGWYDFWQGSIYTNNWNQTVGDGIIEMTACRLGSTAADCLADTSITSNEAYDSCGVWDSTQGAAVANGHSGNCWIGVATTRDTALFVVPAEFQAGGTVPTNTVAPAVTGTKSSGSVLTTTNGTWTQSPTSYSYIWQSSLDGNAWAAVGTSATTYTLTAAEVGLLIRCVVTATNAAGAGSPTASAATTIVDDGAGNYVGNSTFETNITGWSQNQGPETLAQTGAQFHAGTKSMSVTTPGTTVREGAYFGPGHGVNNAAGTQRQLSAWVQVPTGKSVLVAFNTYDITNSRIQQTPVTITGNTGVWQQATVTDTAPTGAVYSQVSVTTGDTIQGTTFYVDDVTVTVPAATIPTFDAAGAGASSAAASSLTWLHTCTGTNRLLVVAVGYGDAGRTVTGVTYNGVALTQLLRVTQGDASDMWYLIAPATGSHSVVVTMSSSTVAMACTSASYTSVNQTTPFASSTSNHATPVASLTGTISSSVNQLVVGQCVMDGRTTLTSDAGQTRRANVAISSSTVTAIDDKTGASSVTMGWTGSGGSNSHAMVIMGTLQGPAVASAPTSTVVPAVTGTATNGQMLTSSLGTWANTPTGYAYQWQRDVAGNAVYSNIASASLSTYTLQNADVGNKVRCIVTASNTGGSASASALPTAIVANAVPTNSSPPVISVPVLPSVLPLYSGTQLQADTGEWLLNPTTYSYQWKRADDLGFTVNVTNVGVDASAYTIPASLVGKYVRLTLTGSNSAGANSANSNVVGPVVAEATERTGSVPI